MYVICPRINEPDPDKEKAVNAKAATTDASQGWLCRNGSLAVKDGSLLVTPDANAGANARVFLTHSGLDVAGPVAATLRVRAKQGGAGSFTWRTKAEKDFTAENTAGFNWPASAEWREIKAELPVKGRLMHLRITPAKASAGLEIQSIELRGRDSKPQVWDFGASK